MDPEQLDNQDNGLLTTAEESSIIDTLRFDPFADKPKGSDASAPAGDSKGAGAAASPGQASPRSDASQPVPPPAASDGAPGTSTPAPPTQPVAQPSPVDVAAQRLADAADRFAASATPAAQPQGDKPKSDIPEYLYDIPAPILNGLVSENPQERGAAVQALIAGTARAVHTELAKTISEVRQSIPQVFAQMAQTQEYNRRVRTEFYGKYPALDNPNLAPVVAQASQAVMAEMAAQGHRVSWSPQLADAIAARVFAAIPGLQGQPQPQKAPPAQQPPHVFAPGSRPAQGQSPEAVISDMLGLA